MRLDVFLKYSRLVERRAIAKELCDDGAALLNGRPARAGKNVVVGDRLIVRLWNRRLEIEVEIIPLTAVSSAESRTLNRFLSDRRIEESQESEDVQIEEHEATHHR